MKRWPHHLRTLVLWLDPPGSLEFHSAECPSPSVFCLSQKSPPAGLTQEKAIAQQRVNSWSFSKPQLINCQLTPNGHSLHIKSRIQMGTLCPAQTGMCLAWNEIWGRAVLQPTFTDLLFVNDPELIAHKIIQGHTPAPEGLKPKVLFSAA